MKTLALCLCLLLFISGVFLKYVPPSVRNRKRKDARREESPVSAIPDETQLPKIVPEVNESTESFPEESQLKDLPVPKVKNHIPNLQEQDVVLIIGGRNTLSGSLRNDGFITILREESKRFLSTISIFTLEWPICNLRQLLEDETKLEYLKQVQPTKIYFFFENADLECIDSNHLVASFSDLRFSVEALLLRFLKQSNVSSIHHVAGSKEAVVQLRTDIQITLVPLCIINECINYRLGQDPIFEELIDMLYRITIFYDQIYFVDLTIPTIKLLEQLPKRHGEKDSTVLTYDGMHLNPLGHQVLAVALIQKFLTPAIPLEQRNSYFDRLLNRLYGELAVLQADEFTVHEEQEL